MPRERMTAIGSSPLARGLLHVDYEGIEFDRIIPARAGFTRTVRGFLILLLDHPRSRGVYA